MPPTATGKKKGGQLLGSRPLLPAAAIDDGDRSQQQEARQACLQLAGQLLLRGQGLPAAGQAPDGSFEGFASDFEDAEAVPPPPPPPPPPTPPVNPAAALLLDCAADPLTAGLALGQQAAKLGSDAGSAGSGATRLHLAHRAAAAALFCGDVAAAVQLLLQHDALTADFVSMSAAAGGPFLCAAGCGPGWLAALSLVGKLAGWMAGWLAGSCQRGLAHCADCWRTVLAAGWLLAAGSESSGQPADLQADCVYKRLSCRVHASKACSCPSSAGMQALLPGGR
jgi:hypothetical protein